MTLEQVLVFPEDTLKERYFEGAVKLSLSYCNLQYHIFNRELLYMNRDEAETNPAFKQIIPYCVIVHNDKVFCYQRTKKGGEKRLHDLYSLGVGGHINPCDKDYDGYHCGTRYASNISMYERAMTRELDEEIGLKGIKENKIIGFLYDPSNDVGKVHFGIVHKIELKDDYSMTFFDNALTNGAMCDKLWVKDNHEKFENWSKLVIENLL